MFSRRIVATLSAAATAEVGVVLGALGESFMSLRGVRTNSPGAERGGSSAALVAGACRFLFPLLVQLLQEIVESYLLVRRENRPDIGAPLPANLLARSIERGVESLPFGARIIDRSRNLGLLVRRELEALGQIIENLL